MTVLLERFGDPWSVLREMEEMQSRMNRAFGQWGGPAGGRYPSINVWTASDGVIVDLALPGVDPKAVDISVEGDRLEVSGTREPGATEKDARYHGKECYEGEFARAVHLPFRAEAGKVSARYRNGVLRISVPRAEADKPKQVTIEVS